MLEYVVGFIACIYYYKYFGEEKEEGEKIEEGRRFTNTTSAKYY